MLYLVDAKANRTWPAAAASHEKHELYKAFTWIAMCLRMSFTLKRASTKQEKGHFWIRSV